MWPTENICSQEIICIFSQKINLFLFWIQNFHFILVQYVLFPGYVFCFPNIIFLRNIFLCELCFFEIFVMLKRFSIKNNGWFYDFRKMFNEDCMSTNLCKGNTLFSIRFKDALKQILNFGSTIGKNLLLGLSNRWSIAKVVSHFYKLCGFRLRSKALVKF